MHKKSYFIKHIGQTGERDFEIQWTDGVSQSFDVVHLRRKCPCATCIDEWTREERLQAHDIADSVRPVQIKAVGRYAVSIKFNDGHTTGIYPYGMLRELGQTK